MQAEDRLHYMDHLRALAMLAGVLFHAALAYSPLMSGVFPTADRQNSVWVDVVVWGLHLVRMPLFFFVAGFFAVPAEVFELRVRPGLALDRFELGADPVAQAFEPFAGALGVGLPVGHLSSHARVKHCQGPFIPWTRGAPPHGLSH